MITLIVSPARLEAARKAAEHHGGAGYERVGPLDSAGIREAFVQAARGAAEVLILDLDAGPGPDIVAALRRFRIQRPTTRVIVLAPGREPGDVTVAGIVARGVYDIIAAPEDAAWDVLIRQTLDRPPATYAQAARWDTGGEGETPAATAAEKVVIERRPAGRRLVVVAGLQPGVGCTFAALQIAGFLARQGVPATVVDAGARPPLGEYARRMGMGDGEHLAADGRFLAFSRAGLRIVAPGQVALWNWDPQLRIAIAYAAMQDCQAQEDGVIVLDAGDAAGNLMAPLAAAAAQIFWVAGGAAWRLPAEENIPHGRGAILLTPATPALARHVARETGREAWALPFCPGHAPPGWTPGEEAAQHLRDMLRQHLPERMPGGGWRLWRRRKRAS